MCRIQEATSQRQVRSLLLSNNDTLWELGPPLHRLLRHVLEKSLSSLKFIYSGNGSSLTSSWLLTLSCVIYLCCPMGSRSQLDCPLSSYILDKYSSSSRKSRGKLRSTLAQPWLLALYLSCKLTKVCLYLRPGGTNCDRQLFSALKPQPHMRIRKPESLQQCCPWLQTRILPLFFYYKFQRWKGIYLTRN